MNPPLGNGTSKAYPPGTAAVLAGQPARLLSGLLLGVAVVFAAAGARADLIAGCGDSLTDGYLPWIQDVYGVGEVEDQAVGARWSGGSLTALEGYLAVEDPESVVLLSGTVDAFIGPFWQPGGSPIYDEAQTVGNIIDMVDATITDGATPILVAPPPVYPPCDGSVDPTCLSIEDRLASLGYALEDEVADPLSPAYGVDFIDLHPLFLAYPDPYSLYDGGTNDGLHPDDEGDRVIAQAVLDELGPVVGAPCEDGVDNDGDGAVDWDGGPFGDPADPDCDDASDWSEGAAVLECDDGLDNDADGAADLDDFGCHGRGDFSERTAPNVIACDDGIDNDGDGTIDFLGDAGCGTPLQMNENPKCNDGRDNDGDGLIDFDGGDSLDLDRDGFVDPEFNSAEPEVTDPDPHCSVASIDQESSGSGCRWHFRSRWQKKCRWRCAACDPTPTTPPPAEKVTLCHKAKNTLSVGASAVPAHQAHGDTLGSCPSNHPPAKVRQIRGGLFGIVDSSLTRGEASTKPGQLRRSARG
jgi:hypothetical protein